jgi:hypothetical protein
MRLDTFQDAPCQTAGGISYSQLACDGYIYIREKFLLQCVYCLEFISNWRNVTSVDALRPQHKANCDPSCDDFWAESDDDEAMQVDGLEHLSYGRRAMYVGYQVDGLDHFSSPARESPETVNLATEIDLSKVRQAAGGW